MRESIFVAIVVATSAGCLKGPVFTCLTDADCVQSGTPGTCEPVGYCSFADSSCEDGRRFGELAGPLSLQCVKVRHPVDASLLDAYVPDAYVPDALIRLCFGTGAYRVCFAQPQSGDVALAGSLDTGTDVRCLASQPADWATAGQPDACFITGRTVTVSANLAVAGSRPLVLIGDTITVSAVLDVASHRGGTIGPGSPATTCTAFTSAPDNRTTGAGGGAGGSFGTAGGNGGRGDNVANGGVAPAADVLPPSRLRAGCAGQPGGLGAAAAGTVGGGGGALYLAAGTLVISGTVNASGAGAAGGGFSSGGSGAGAGGMIVIHAESVTVATSRLLANGGGGASGGDNNTLGNAGGDPPPTTPGIAATGGSSNGTGAVGGSGFAASAVATSGGNGATAKAGGGGGGGGGYVQSNIALTGATTSPVVTVVP